jgi:hypothetical protein
MQEASLECVKFVAAVSLTQGRCCGSAARSINCRCGSVAPAALDMQDAAISTIAFCACESRAICCVSRHLRQCDPAHHLPPQLQPQLQPSYSLSCSLSCNSAGTV